MATRARLLTEPANEVDAYALAVERGTIPAGKYHRLACVRHLSDRAREGSAEFPFRYQHAQAEKFYRFAGKMRHYKGRQFAGQLIALSDAQRFRLGSIFGWRHRETRLRRFTTAYNELPRKSGKTLEAGVVAVYVVFYEGEPGAEGYCIATKREQAKRVFDDAATLVRRAGLSGRIAVLTNNMHRQDRGQKLEPLGADADSTDGLNPYLIITDEFHAHKTRKLVDVMESATGARLTFLHFLITTAGDDPVSPCGTEHDYACRILDGVLDDDEATESYFAFIAHADEGDDWLAEATWRKANPQWGISVNPADLKKLALAAKHVPEKAAEFKQKRLNLWVNRKAPSLSVDGWRKGQRAWPEAELKGRSCYAGLDLSAKMDLTSLTLLFPPAPGDDRFRLIQRIWTPEETLRDRAHRDRAPYDVWAAQGWLRLVPGTSIKQRMMRDELNLLADDYNVALVGYDQWHAEQLQEQLTDDDGWDEEAVVEVPQTFAGMSVAELRFKSEVLGGHVDARGCPVTAWAVSNVVDQTDGKANILFSKKHSRGRIDPVKSATIAMSCWLREPVPKAKTYQALFFGGDARA